MTKVRWNLQNNYKLKNKHSWGLPPYMWNIGLPFENKMMIYKIDKVLQDVSQNTNALSISKMIYWRQKEFINIIYSTL